MISPKDEGLKTVNNIPLPVEFLIQNFTGPVSGTWSGMHYHDYIEILYSLKGDFDVMLNGEIIHLPHGTMFIANAGEPHTTKSASAGDRTLLCIKFMPQVLFSSKQSVTEMEYSIPYVFDNFGSMRTFDPTVLENTVIPGEFEYLVNEQQRKKFGYELAIRSGVMRIFSWIMRYWYENAKEPDIPLPNRNAVETVRKIREYVDKSYADATLLEAAEAVGLSYSYFSRVFNEYMKMSFSDYVNLVRVNQSLKLLASTDMSVTEIALSVGFSSTSYYIQIFKKLKNLSPGAFRKMFR